MGCGFPVYRLELASQACVAEVEGEELLVGDFRGFLVEAGFLEAVGTLEQPSVLGHGGDQQGFGGFGWFVLVAKGSEQGVVLSLVFAGLGRGRFRGCS